jgi:uncharacterized protein (DUF2141 family)
MTRAFATTLAGVVLAIVHVGHAEAPAGKQDDHRLAPAATLNVPVVDLRNRKGSLRLGVFDRARGFPKDRKAAILWQSVPADADAPTFVVDLPPGQYAVVVLHDENDNKKLDANLIGIPTEGYGVSNNPKPKRRAATYKEAAFILPAEGAELPVSVQYF